MTGEILDGKYRIEKKLGAGGMGNVYLATHLGTTRPVAVKVIAPKWAADPHFLARFQREAQACGRLRHPNIINVTDFGFAAGRGGGIAYLVMEFLDGQTLSAFQKETPLPPLPLVADLLDQVGLALDEAHRHGIVHRDLKPDNIWLEPDGRGGYAVKVLDFGVAKMNLPGDADPAPEAAAAGSGEAGPGGDEMETVAIAAAAPHEDAETVAMPRISTGASGPHGSDASGQTMPGSLVGTPAFMSPEQALGREIDYRSDIYSLAVVAYSLVCGELPFRGKSSELFEFHRSGAPAPPASVRRMPRDVSDAILAGLAREPAERPASAAALTRRFHNAVDAEYLALRRSRAFLMQHLGPYLFLIAPIYGAVMATAALLGVVGKALLPAAVARVILVPIAAAFLFVFANNVLRAAATLIALDEEERIRRFLSFRVLWKLIKALPALAATQARSLWFFGPGWVTGDCLWPVACVAEKARGKAALRRSRELMHGLSSAGRALAIRHLALAALAIADLAKSLSFVWRGANSGQPNVVVTGSWFPLFAVFAAAPLFLYDRTAARDKGPLLRLDRTPEVRTTARRFSVSSMAWLIVLAVYLLYQPVKLWVFGGK